MRSLAFTSPRDHPGWRRNTRCGSGSRRGGGLVLWAGGQLGKLRRRGLVTSFNELTEAGRKALQTNAVVNDYETEHPAAKRMRLEFEAQFGDMADVMRSMNCWYNTRSAWNDPVNRDREKPITEGDVEDALQKVFSTVRAARSR